ncbi:MAG: hypothetical protein KIT17_16455 [Rubrivivax sp.]|nr:hypothetical protein [Rubrivivax sp.]
MKVLNIVESAYRATLEEQDDTVLWLTQALRGAGAGADVLLVGNAANYAVRGQDAGGLQFGRWRQTQPPRIERDLAALMAKGAQVFVLQEDLARLGIEAGELVEGPQPLPFAGLPSLAAGYDRLWHW